MQPRDSRPSREADIEGVVTRPAGRRPPKRTTATSPRKRAAAKTSKVAKKKITKATTARKKPPAAPLDMSVVASVQRDINELAKREPKISTSGHAALALALAAEMDAKNSATSKSMCARALAETLEKLEGMVPPEETSDAVDQLVAKRAARRRRKSA